jgi:hypothetical protein
MPTKAILATAALAVATLLAPAVEAKAPAKTKPPAYNPAT